MKVDITLYDGAELNLDEAAIDPALGVSYQKSSIVLPGEEDVIKITLIPWAAISSMDYYVTAEMVAEQNQAQAANDVATMGNRKQRRAGLQNA